MLGGCGKSEDEASDQAKATSEAGSGEQTASAEGEAGGAATGDEQEQVTIKFTYWGSGDEEKSDRRSRGKIHGNLSEHYRGFNAHTK